jgi:hypothetical protein
MLGSFLSPLSLAAFVEGHFGRRCLHSRLPEEVLRTLSAVPALGSPRALAGLPAKGLCFSFRHENWLPRVSQVPPEEALAEYEAGCSFYLGKVELGVPLLARACRGIADDLGIPPACVSAQAFASRAGHGLDLHFDHDDNFSLQISGRKSWRVGPNHLVDAPLKSGFWGRALFRELGLAEGQVPAFPALESFEAVPGSLVYVPRGFWHTTRCLEDSVSISFAVRPPYAYQVVLAAVQHALLDAPGARAFAVGVTRPGLPVNREFADAVEPLWARVTALRGGDCVLLPPSPSPAGAPTLKHACFRPGPRAAALDGRAGLDGLPVVLADGSVAPLVVPPRWATTVRTLLEEEAFTLDDGLIRRKGWPAGELERLVEEMVDKELLERIA